MRYRSFLREHCTVVIWLLWSSDMLVLWTCGRASFALVFGSQALFDRYIVAMAIGLALATAFSTAGQPREANSGSAGASMPWPSGEDSSASLFAWGRLGA